MEVETFEVTETLTQPDGGAAVEPSDEAKRLIDELELVGQQKFFEQTDDGDLIQNPYRVMTQVEQLVYGLVCPSWTKLEEYDSGPVPLRVLQVASHAQQFYKVLAVWHPADSKADDPVLVGYEENRYGSKPTLLARWGRVLVPFEDLQATALNLLIDKWTAKLKVARVDIEQTLAQLDFIARDYLSGNRRDYALPECLR
jgi:hypothetical protein